MKIVYLVNDAGVYGANLSLINMIKGLGISRDVFVILPSGGPFLLHCWKVCLSHIKLYHLDIIVIFIKIMF